MPEPTSPPAQTSMLPGFAAQVAALRQSRENKLPQRVGVIVPTFNRPDLIRACVLQLTNQSRAPDVICVHQNGHPDSYQWAVADLHTGATRVIWLHTPSVVQPHEWYAVPLKRLIEDECTHFFWADHDDLYLHNHIEAGIAALQTHDFSVSRWSGLLFTKPKPTDFRYGAKVEFTSHAPGGMSSTMCFRRRFAQELLADIARDNNQTQYTDNVVANVTMPKFLCHVGERNTSIYHSHEGSLTSSEWLTTAFK